MELPIDFIQRTRAALGGDYEAFEASLRAEAPTSIRINRRKGAAAPRGGEPVAWCDSGFYLPERPAFTFDPLLHAGAYYVQEASSMFLEQAVRSYASGPVRCLDLCAAPGGKSTHLAALLPEGSVLVCNEVIRSRAYVLAENVAKWGRGDTAVLNNDPEEIGRALPHFFDVIVADVPCSGEGMFRKDPDSVREWSVENVQLCAARQRRIIHDIWEALRPGGLLIYSTCTYNPEEDEENVRYIIETFGAEALSVPTRPEWGVAGATRYDAPCYHFFPHRARGEGFFLALLQKTSGGATARSRQRGREERQAGGELWRRASAWLRPGGAFAPIALPDGTLAAVGEELRADVMRVAGAARVLSAGVPLAVERGRKAVPHAALATSLALAPDAFPCVELDTPEAVAFLRRETLQLPPEAPRGYVVVTYDGLPLGFLNNLGSRANNLYPAEWRIRSSHVAETPHVVLTDA